MRHSWQIRKLVLSLALVVLAHCSVAASEGIIYFNRIQNLLSAVPLFRANADGSGEQFVPVPLPAAFNPAVSRDGEWVLISSGDPGRPFKLSNNVFAYNVANGGVSRITGYEDVVRYGNTFLTNDLGGTNIVGDRSTVGYQINYPFYKAPSPDGTRAVVINLQRSGGSARDIPRTNSPLDSGSLTIGSMRAPIVEVFQAGNPAVVGQTVYLGAERTGFNQGGDGVDWHPSKEAVVASVRSDIPATGNTGATMAEGTVLAVFSTQPSLDPFLRRLTTPSGTWFSYVDIFTSYLTSSTQHDYSPSISPDGTKVAYLRHTQRTDSRISLGPLLALCEIRVINYDGTGDHSILQFAEGVWATKVVWSPNGTQLAFDISPQVILAGYPALTGDVTVSEIHVVNADGSNPHRVIGAPASHPSWAPGSLPGAGTPFQLQMERGNDGGLRLRAIGGNPGDTVQVFSSDDLLNWTPFSEIKQTADGVGLDFPMVPGVSSRFYRILRPQ